MKLKLETAEDVKILTVTETVDEKAVLILKAGLGKMIQSGVESVLLDLTESEKIDKAVAKKVGELKEFAAESDVQLMIATAISSLSDGATSDEVFQRLTSPLAKLLAKEAKLQAQQRKLQRQKKTLETKLQSLSKAGGDIKTLRKENSDLKTKIQLLEERGKLYLNQRNSEPGDFPDFVEKKEKLYGIVNTILEQEKILSIK